MAEAIAEPNVLTICHLQRARDGRILQGYLPTVLKMAKLTNILSLL